VDDKLGKLAYDAYCTQLGVGPDQDVPHWDGLEGQYRDAWIAAARTVEAHVRGQREEWSA
jgi:hypothetical protein